MLRWVAAFCRPLRPLRPLLLLVSFPRSRSPVVGVLGWCWLLRGSRLRHASNNAYAGGKLYGNIHYIIAPARCLPWLPFNGQTQKPVQNNHVPPSDAGPEVDGCVQQGAVVWRSRPRSPSASPACLTWCLQCTG